MHCKTIIFHVLLKDTLVMVQNCHESAIKVNIQKKKKAQILNPYTTNNRQTDEL